MPRNTAGFRGKGSGGPPTAPSGRQLRKERRKEERVNSKKRAAPLVPNFEGHDSESRSARRRVELVATVLKKFIEKEEERLKKWTPPKTPEQLEAQMLKERGSGLKGAARPAWEVYPELYPEMHKEEPPEPTFDLIARHTPRCYEEAETRRLVGLYFQLGHVLLTEDDLKGKGKQSQNAFKRSLELDSSDPFDARLGYFVASLERGEIVEEHEQILKTKEEDGPLRNAELLYHRALVAFMTVTELDKDAGCEEAFENALMEAVEACPDIALALVNHAMVSAVVDTAKVLLWIRDERETRCARATELGIVDRLAGRCDAGVCYTARGMAIAYFVNFAQYWVDGGIVGVMREMLEGAELAEGDEDVEDDDDAAEMTERPSGPSSSSAGDGEEQQVEDKRWIDKTMRRYFEEAAMKFDVGRTRGGEEEDNDDDDDDDDE